MNARERMRFDELVDAVLESLPQQVRDLFDEAPLIIEDRPSRDLLTEMQMDADEDDSLCGLYTGTPMIERSIEDHMRTPDCIQIFREAIVEQAGGWERGVDAEGQPFGGEDEITKEIRITILHELGHHFGFDEDDLARMGYE